MEVLEKGETGQQQLRMERPEKMVFQCWCLQCLYHLTETVKRKRRVRQPGTILLYSHPNDLSLHNLGGLRHEWEFHRHSNTVGLAVVGPRYNLFTFKKKGNGLYGNCIQSKQIWKNS